MATGTPESQARFGQSVKGLLTEKVNTCGTDVIALTKQVLKGSRSSESIASLFISLNKAVLCEYKTNWCCDKYEQAWGKVHRNVQRFYTQIVLQLLGQAARNMVLQEDAILHSEDSLRKMAIITTHLQYQQEAIQKNVEQSSNLQDQLNHLLK